MSLLVQIADNIYKISDADMKKVDDWIFEAEAEGTHYAGMSYEQGMRDMLDFLTGNTTADELTGD